MPEQRARSATESISGDAGYFFPVVRSGTSTRLTVGSPPPLVIDSKPLPLGRPEGGGNLTTVCRPSIVGLLVFVAIVLLPFRALRILRPSAQPNCRRFGAVAHKTVKGTPTRQIVPANSNQTPRPCRRDFRLFSSVL